jgi:hypothetical protein
MNEKKNNGKEECGERQLEVTIRGLYSKGDCIRK